MQAAVQQDEQDVVLESEEEVERVHNESDTRCADVLKDVQRELEVEREKVKEYKKDIEAKEAIMKKGCMMIKQWKGVMERLGKEKDELIVKYAKLDEKYQNTKDELDRMTREYDS